MTTSCRAGQQVLALNGEIYNYRELRSQLARGHRFVGGSDTELLAHLFEDRGTDCLNDLNGMFAFAVSSGETTWIVRDRLGIKPLYYRIEDGALRFASEARVLAGRVGAPQLPPTYREFETLVGNDTPFPGVRAVPPGCYLEYDTRTGQHRIIRYYTLPTEAAGGLTEAEAVDQLRWLVTDSVRLRTDTQLPYGCYASGGLDSSLVSMLSKPEWLFSAVVTERDYMNEERYIRVLRSVVPARYEEVRVTPDDLLASFVDMVRVLDFPTSNLSAFTQYALSAAVHRRGLRIMLGGIGVDEILTGYTRHVAAALPGRARAIAAQYPSYLPLLAKLGDPCPPDLLERYYRLVNRTGMPSAAGREVIAEAMATQPGGLRRLAAVDLAVSFPPLLRCDDRINMRFSVEGRSPFLDYRIVDFCLRLPDELKLRHGANGVVLTKYLLRKAFSDLLPHEIVNRTDKVGFPSPVLLWLPELFAPAVRQARHIVGEVPALAELFSGLQSEGEFSRTDWQLMQWAAWCLLNVHGLSVAEATVELFGSASQSRVSAGKAS